jgi:DNA-binding transcriptional LysR family regulator
MDTKSLAVLVNAAAGGSISAAARRLGLSPIVAARRIASLEHDLGVRLLHRTTRSISLTPEGQAFLPYAESILESEASGRTLLRPENEGAAGLLRVTTPASLGLKVVVPMLPKFLSSNPQLKLDLYCTDRIVDIVGEGMDLAIRISDLNKSSLIVRRIGKLRRVICASPGYIARYGRPRTLEELADHQCLTLTGMTHWVFGDARSKRRIPVKSRVSCSTFDALHEACLQGLGLSMHASWHVDDDVNAGRLVDVPLDATPYAPQISALYPSSQMVPSKVRVFIKALTEARLARG